MVDEAETLYTMSEKDHHLALLAQLHEHQMLIADKDHLQVSEFGTYFMKSICQARPLPGRQRK